MLNVPWRDSLGKRFLEQLHHGLSLIHESADKASRFGQGKGTPEMLHGKGVLTSCTHRQRLQHGILDDPDGCPP